MVLLCCPEETAGENSRSERSRRREKILGANGLEDCERSRRSQSFFIAGETLGVSNVLYLLMARENSMCARMSFGGENSVCARVRFGEESAVLQCARE